MSPKQLVALQADMSRAATLSQRIGKRAVELSVLTARLDALTAKIERVTRDATLAALSNR